jgi:hypothetical protein
MISKENNCQGRNIMAERCGRGKLLTLWQQGRRKQQKKEEARDRNSLQRHSPVSYFLQ